MSRPVIEARDLRFRYGDGTEALKGVSFRLDEGECVALLGPNGSGKTTFMLHLNGLLEGQGSVEVCGLHLERQNLAAIRRKVGLVFQDSESQLFMPTVLEDVAFGPINRGMSRPEALERAMAALRTVGMEARAARAPYHLSAGEQKKAAIAGILATDPEILALDEPTTFLDPPGQRALAELLGELPQAKLIVTHNIPFAQALCRRAVFFEGGEIVADGPLDEVVARFGWDMASVSRPRR
jgi:energy-coupling factor transporter ATP-binding protein EcfA2